MEPEQVQPEEVEEAPAEQEHEREQEQEEEEPSMEGPRPQKVIATLKPRTSTVTKPTSAARPTCAA